MSSSRRTTTTSSRSKPQESNENEPPRSPLNSIQDPQPDNHPAKFPGSAPRSPRPASTRPVSRVSGSGGGSARISSARFLRGLHDAKPSVAAEVDEVPCFDLDEDPSFWKDRNVQVLIRVRPINSMESASQGYSRCLIQESSQTLKWTGHPETRFTFDHVASETTSQEKLFKVVGSPMVENCMAGYNSCMFAYGQTGSGKTFTMMGEIHEKDRGLSDSRGMTPRIFEYLFIRIKEEEERRYNEQLKYSCKCSFLEIYNEQITDLLEPSSSNLQLREDIKKGVYVENLKEREVSSVTDVMDLLLQGAANRKMAATHMNSESSRSHSVFTCVIESRWEKDSMTHLRFGRLNLVDLAGSERQKSSGAEGERLKEAANINRSLSTLGLVIMTLVDITNGKNRHVPYRDSRLTFLLQDSLGGNSKTTIIANISPSICSAGETLSTLKFAQRAKLIQNNAKVNEDASGDVMALQRQIQNLKDQLTVFTKHQSVPISLCYSSPSLEKVVVGDFYDDSFSFLSDNPAAPNETSFLQSEIKQLNTSLVSALRREETAEAAVRKLKAEITHMNRLVHQREVEAQRAKTLLKFRDEKLRRLELLADDLVSSDGYLMEENVALSQENQLLRELIDMNPELTQFALENMRLLEQLRAFQNFYQHGERDTLLSDISGLRNQLLKVHEGRFPLVNTEIIQENEDTTEELENCRMQLDACVENNAKLTREVDDLRHQLQHYLEFGKSTGHMVEDSSRNSFRVQEPDNVSLTTLFKEDSGDTAASLERTDRVPQTMTDQDIEKIRMQFNTVQKEFTDAKFLIKSMEAHQAQLEAEIDDLKQERKEFLKLSRSTSVGTDLMEHLDPCLHIVGHKDAEQTECRGTVVGLCATPTRSDAELKQTRCLSRNLLDDHTLLRTCNYEMHHVHDKVESETVKTVLYLQEQFDTHQQECGSNSEGQFSSTDLRTKNEELDRRQCYLIQENIKLSNLIAEKEAEISAISYEWEKAITDLTTFLIDGCRSMDDASEHIDSVLESFPRRNGCDERVERAIKVYIEKQTMIANLQKCLEEARQMGLEMKSKLNSLRGATLAITEVQQLKNDDILRELHHLKKLLDEKVSTVQRLENAVKCKDDDIGITERLSSSAFEVLKRLYNIDLGDSTEMVEIKLVIGELLNENAKANTIEHVKRCNDAKRNHSTQQLSTKEMCQTLKTLEERVEKIDIWCSQTKEVMQRNLNHEQLEAEDRTKHASTFLVKFEAAQQTIEEAELVLQELLKVNETVKLEKDWWEKKCKELLAENSVLVKDARQLEVSILSKENQYENLHDKIMSSLTEMVGVTSSLRGTFQQIERTIEEELNVICFDIASIRQELVKSIDIRKSWLEDIISDVMEQGFASFVLYICHRGALYEQVIHFDTLSDSLPRKHVDNCSLHKNEDTNKNNVGARVLEGVKDKEIIQNHMFLNCSNLGGTKEVLNTIYFVDTNIGNYERAELLSNHIYPQERGSKLERENMYLTNHMGLVDDIDFDLTTYRSQENCSRCGLKQANGESQDVTLKRELTRKDDLIKGLLFDLRLLQESTFNNSLLKDEFEEMADALNRLRHELAAKTAQTETILEEKKVLEVQAAKSVTTLSITMQEIEQTQKELMMLSDENSKLKLLLEDGCMKKAHTEELLEEKTKVIEGLQREILYINSSVGGQLTSSVEEIIDELGRVSNERDRFHQETVYLSDKLEMFSSLADENEAIAVEARQIAEASRVYAEEKEEEVKVLESSVEELEGTINVMERKVYELKEEVESHQLIREGLELEIQALTKRMLTVENAAVNLIAEYSNMSGGNCQLPRRLDDRIIELCEANKRIEDLEMEKSYTAEEIKQYQEHISELVLHSEAQSSLYQEKFKALEAMVSEVKPDSASSNPVSTIPVTRPRGSGSPFRCISSLVHQMNLEKDQELSVARRRIVELETLAANRQKEICMLMARLAAAESMTHDVIRDLLGVKLDMNNYANLIDQEELQQLLEKAKQQSEEMNAQEKEILDLKSQINDLISERESLVEERNERQAEILASEVAAERLQRRIQLLTAKNEMLKMDKADLQEKLEDLEDKVKFSAGSLGVNGHQMHEGGSSRTGNEKLSKRLAQSDKLLSHMRTSMKSVNVNTDSEREYIR